jgi:GrpB-like predicted nucleotidyltransferase (UPF0157 family)
MLGLPSNVNILVDYDSRWPQEFDREASAIIRVAGPYIKSIEHYGSTSVPGLRAKPILDILVGLLRLEDWIHCKSPLESIGYDYAEHAGVPNHYVFGKGKARTHLVHLVQFGSDSWIQALRFREMLRNDAKLREEYTQIKEAAIKAHPDSRSKYNVIKGPFIEKMMKTEQAAPLNGSNSAKAALHNR